MTLDASGNLGVGTTSPSGSSRLHVVGNRTFLDSGDQYTLRIGTVANGVGGYIGSTAVDVLNFYNGSGTERARIDSSGNLLVRTSSQGGGAVLTVKSSGATGIGQGIAIVKNDSSDYWSQNVDSAVGYTWGKNGSDFWYAGRSGSNNCVSNNGSWVNSSDARLKEDINPLQNCLQDVCKLQGVSFTRINGGQQEIGLIAQEVEKVFPRAVEPPKTENDNYALNYGALVAPLIEAIKEQQALITQLQADVAALKA